MAGLLKKNNVSKKNKSEHKGKIAPIPSGEKVAELPLSAKQRMKGEN